MRSAPLKLVVLAVAWVVVTRLALDYGALLLPAAVARQLTIEEFLPLAQTVTLVLGIGLAWALLDDPRAELGLRGAKGRAVAAAAVAAPIVWVLAFGVAIAIALPTLLAELRRGGADVARQDLGQFGRAVREGDLALTLAWTTLFAPFTEELLFRGAVWSALRRLTAPGPTAVEAPRSLPAELLSEGIVVRGARALFRSLRDGGFATIGSAAVFGAMHLGVPGGAGLVRVVSATCLGLACGAARHASGGLAAPVALHFGYNLVSIAHARGWLVTASLPKVYGMPAAALILAGGSIVALAIAAVVTRASRPIPVDAEEVAS